MVPKAESESRMLRLKKELAEEGIDGALFLYPIDVYYYCGTRQNAALWVPAEGVPTLFVRKSYMRALEESLVEDVRPFPSTSDFPGFFGKRKRIGLTLDVLPVQLYRFYAGLLEDMDFVDISGINRQLRSVKSEWEIEQMRASGRRLCDAFSQVPVILKQGMSELDLAAGFEHILRSSGSDGHLRIRAFHQEIVGLTAAGSNAALPGCFDGAVTGRGLSGAAPYGPSRDTIEKGAPIIMDYGHILNGYIVDMTRIFVFGRLDPELEAAFELSLKIQEWLLENMRPDRICEDLFAGAAAIAGEAGLGDRFMGYPGEQSKFVGHGVGLELDELPNLAQKFRSRLRAGQTIAIEPKFVFPGKGVVGIENTYAVTGGGCERLTDLSDTIVML